MANCDKAGCSEVATKSFRMPSFPEQAGLADHVHRIHHLIEDHGVIVEGTPISNEPLKYCDVHMQEYWNTLAAKFPAVLLSKIAITNI